MYITWETKTTTLKTHKTLFCRWFC